MKKSILKGFGTSLFALALFLPAIAESQSDASDLNTEGVEISEDSFESVPETEGCCIGGDYSECAAAFQTLPPLPEELPSMEEDTAGSPL